MSDPFDRIRRRSAAKLDLARLLQAPQNVLVIHYSCQSFYDRTGGSSARITSIAVRNLATAQTTSFSIHQMAERDKKLKAEEIEENYDDLEKKMLKEFYEYVDAHQGHTWLHWNMRDINYGFAAIARRYRVLGGKPVDIHESQLCDLARLLVGVYGVAYAGHPRLTRLVEKNTISNRDFLTGEDEAAAFERREYAKLHQSTLRKVDILANIIERAADGSLRTNATFHEIYGGYFPAAIEIVRTHWVFVLLGLLGAVASIVGLVPYFVRGIGAH